MFSFSHRYSRKPGFTLIELMVALAVISVLASIALPTLKNTLRGQRLNRGASLVQAAIADGRARAIVSGGGGIIIDRLGDQNAIERSQAVRIRMAMTPPPYTGDFASSRVHARYQFVVDGTTQGPVTNPAGPRGQSTAADPQNPFWDYHVLLFDDQQLQMLRSARDIANNSEPTLINVQDVIHLGAAGVPMSIQSIDELNAATAPPWTFWRTDPTEGPGSYPNGFVMVEVRPQEPNTNLRRHERSDLTFSITRSPRPAIAMPVELPRGSCIDLTASGIGRFGNQFSPMAISQFPSTISGNYLDTAKAPFTTGTLDYESIYILFGSRGEVSRVLVGQVIGATIQLSEIPVTGDIHLLVGEAGEVKTEPSEQLEDNDPNPLEDEAKDGKTPLLNVESVWVTIKSRNGEVVVSPWTASSPATLIPAPNPVPTDALRETRIQTVIARTRSAAVDSSDIGSL